MTGRPTSESQDANPAAIEGGDGPYCPFFQHALEVIGRRWSGSILRVLEGSEMRFGEIRSHVPGLSDRMLDTRLTELVAEGIVGRRESASAVRYSLTERGSALAPIFNALAEWCQLHGATKPAPQPGRRRA